MTMTKRGRGRPKKIWGYETEAQASLAKKVVVNIDSENIVDPNRIETVDMSDGRLEKLAQGYFVGTTAVGKRRDLRRILEDRVINTIGKKGKVLVDKLFELIEGIYVVSKIATVHGVEEVTAYKEPPSLNAIIYAIDRVLGKPKQLQVQATFSLSQLLIGNNTNNGNGRIRSGNNEAVPEKPDTFY